MIGCYKQYHIAYWTIGIILLLGMIAFDFMYIDLFWLSFIVCIALIILDAVIFTRLTSKKLANEVIVLLNDCRIHDYINEVDRLLSRKKGPTRSMYNFMIAAGYCMLNDYDKVYECCQKITVKSHKSEYHIRMIDYYLNKEQLELAKKEIEELKKLLPRMRNKTARAGYEMSLKSAEYALRIRKGNYEGAEEFYLGVLASPNTKANITRTSYSYALGKLLVLTGDPEGARPYLKTSIETAGDSKYKEFSEKKLAEIDQAADKNTAKATD